MFFGAGEKLKAMAVIAGAAALAVLISYYYRGWYGTSQGISARTVEITYSFTVHGIPADSEDVRVWVPMPLVNEYQDLLGLEVEEDWPYEMVEGPVYGNRFLVLDLSGASSDEVSQASLSIKFLVVRYAKRSFEVEGPAYLMEESDLAAHLGPNRLIPINGKIASEAYRVVGDEKDSLRRARILYDHIVSTLSYDKSGSGWGRGDAVYACDVRKGNCTDFHSLFIGEARALHIPARFIMGLPLPEEQKEGEIGGYHCWAEFYLPDRGWVALDAAEANKFPEKKEFFFGGVDEHRVAFTIGRDIKLPGSGCSPMNYVIYPHVEIDGREHIDVHTKFSFRNYPGLYKERVGFL